MKMFVCLAAVLAMLSCVSGCSGTRNDLDYDYAVEQTWILDDPSVRITQFESVPFAPLNTETLRAAIRKDQLVDSCSVLEIGTGTGFFAIVCAREGAKRIVAVALDPASHACARYNVAADAQDAIIEVRSASNDSQTTASDTTASDTTASDTTTASQSDSAAVAARRSTSPLAGVLGDPGRFDLIVLGSEAPLSEQVVVEVLDALPMKLFGGGRCWVICQDAESELRVQDHAQSLGFGVTEMVSAAGPASRAGEPSFPKTLQIDPFVGGSGGQSNQSPLPAPPS